MNAVVLAILIMLTLSLMRVSVVFALIVAAVAGGLYAGMPMSEVVSAFNGGLGGGAPIALAYATLGAFAVVLARSGVSQRLSQSVVRRLDGDPAQSYSKVKWALLAGLILIGFISGTLVPVHIAFIPIVVPPLLHVMNRLNLDRRAVACAITFSITVTYMSMPIGFGTIFLNDILIGNINQFGQALDLVVDRTMAPTAMFIPAMGMIFGLLIALFVSYRRPRKYADIPMDVESKDAKPLLSLKPYQSVLIVAGLVVALIVQLWTGSMIFGALAGFSLVSLSGVIRWNEQDSTFTEGMRLMSMVGFIMITAAGFAGVMNATGDIPSLVDASVTMIGDNKALAAFIMLLIGLVITLGIGSSFSTVPIIASIYVPLALSFGFSPLAIVSLVGTAAALGDAGSPASDSTLGPTAGLNVDGQHDHMWDTVIPTFLHYNLPLLAFGWAAAMIL